MIWNTRKYSRNLLAAAAFLFAGPALAEDSKILSGPPIFAGNAPVLVAELRQGVVADLREQFIAAAKSEPREVAGRMEQPKPEWALAARLESE